LNSALARWSPEQIHVTVRTVVAIWLVVLVTTEPPWRLICSSPCCLLWNSGVHGILRTTTTAILRSGNVNDPMRSAQGCSRDDECLPVSAGTRRKDLHAFRATVLIQRSGYREALLALHQQLRGVPRRQGDWLTLARLWTAFLWLRPKPDLLAVVGLGVIIATLVVESDPVLILVLLAQAQEAVSRIITAWLLELRAAEPPWRFVRSTPRLLVRVLPVHGI